MILLTRGTESSQIYRDKKWKGGCQGVEREGNGKLLFKGRRVSVWEDEKVLEMDCTPM